MNIKEKLGKKIHDFIKSQGLIVITNEQHEREQQKIKDLNEYKIQAYEQLIEMGKLEKKIISQERIIKDLIQGT